MRTSSLGVCPALESKNGNKDDTVRSKDVAAVKCKIETAKKQCIALDLKFCLYLKGLIHNFSFRTIYLAVGCGRLIQVTVFNFLVYGSGLFLKFWVPVPEEISEMYGDRLSI